MCKFLNRVRNYFVQNSLETLFSKLENDHELQTILYGAYDRRVFDREYTRLDNGWMYVVYSDVNRDSVCLFEITVKDWHPILRTLLPFEMVNASAQTNAEVIERLTFKSNFGHVTQEQSTYGKIRYYLAQPLRDLKESTLKATLKTTLREFIEVLRPELGAIQQEISDDAALYREHSEDDDEVDN
jgi:hypothetical protein